MGDLLLEVAWYTKDRKIKNTMSEETQLDCRFQSLTDEELIPRLHGGLREIDLE